MLTSSKSPFPIKMPVSFFERDDRTAVAELGPAFVVVASLPADGNDTFCAKPLLGTLRIRSAESRPILRERMGIRDNTGNLQAKLIQACCCGAGCSRYAYQKIPPKAGGQDRAGWLRDDQAYGPRSCGREGDLSRPSMSSEGAATSVPAFTAGLLAESR